MKFILTLLYFSLVGCLSSQGISNIQLTPDFMKKIKTNSQKVALPYGKREIINYDFPKHWYCGGGYLESSLQEAQLDNIDSIKYAAAYDKIIKFNRDIDSDLEQSKSILLEKENINMFTIRNDFF